MYSHFDDSKNHPSCAPSVLELNQRSREMSKFIFPLKTISYSDVNDQMTLQQSAFMQPIPSIQIMHFIDLKI